MNRADSTQESWIEASRESGFGLATVVSGSMSPVLNVGDKVYVKFADQKKYCIGDVVVFPASDHLTVHRIVGKFFTQKGTLFVHKGDAAKLMAVGIVKQEHILGTAIIVRKGSEVIPVSSHLSKTIRVLSPFYSLLAAVLWLRRTIA